MWSEAGPQQLRGFSQRLSGPSHQLVKEDMTQIVVKESLLFLGPPNPIASEKNTGRS